MEIEPSSLSSSASRFPLARRVRAVSSGKSPDQVVFFKACSREKSDLCFGPAAPRCGDAQAWDLDRASECL